MCRIALIHTVTGFTYALLALHVLHGLYRSLRDVTAALTARRSGWLVAIDSVALIGSKRQRAIPVYKLIISMITKKSPSVGLFFI